MFSYDHIFIVTNTFIFVYTHIRQNKNTSNQSTQNWTINIYNPEVDVTTDQWP